MTTTKDQGLSPATDGENILFDAWWKKQGVTSDSMRWSAWNGWLERSKQTMSETRITVDEVKGHAGKPVAAPCALNGCQYGVSATRLNESAAPQVPANVTSGGDSPPLLQPACSQLSGTPAVAAPELVHAICERFRMANDEEPCEKCPARVEVPHHGEGVPGCYMLAEETVRLVREARVSATPMPEPKLRPDLFPALPGQKALTFLMMPDRRADDADAAIAAMKRGDTIFLPEPISGMFFHQLRLRVALDPTLADKIAVYYLTPERKWQEVGLGREDELRWPVGFEHEAWEKEIQIQAARSDDSAVDAAKEMKEQLQRRYVGGKS